MILPYLAVGETPKRIISLAPSLTKNLYLLEAENLLVGCTNYCTIQSGTEAVVVANAVQVNYEKAVLLQPDLIITTNLTQSKTIETFVKLGVKIIVFDNPLSFDDICTQFVELGEIIGKKLMAEKIIEQAEKKLDNILFSLPKMENRPTVFMQIGTNPLFGVTPGNFMNDYIKFAGGINILNDLKLGTIGFESVLIRNPDIIIVVLMGNVGLEEQKKWQIYSSLNAVKNKKVYIIGADDACSPTPLTFVDALEELTTLIYSKN